jgi:hypothetical protein
MTQSRDPKNQKTSDALSSEDSPVANTLSWRRYIFLGSLLFMIFYCLIPVWLNHELSTLQNSTLRPIAEALFMRRIYWIQLAGIALGSICIVFAIHNYFSARSISSNGRNNTTYLSRLFSKLTD